MGFEPATFSIQLRCSYEADKHWQSAELGIFNTDRTNSAEVRGSHRVETLIFFYFLLYFFQASFVNCTNY